MRTRLLTRPAVFALGLTLLAGPALAQTTLKTQNGMDQGGFYALLNSDVQADLGLSAEQLKKIDKVKLDMQHNMSTTLSAMLPAAGAAFDTEEIGRAIEKHTNKATSDAVKVLTRSQRSRFSQIEMQLQDGMALTRQEVQKKLGLSKSQKSRIDSIANPSEQSDGAQGRNITTIGQMQQKKKEQNNRLLAVLSKSQREKFDEMKGKPLKRKKGS